MPNQPQRSESPKRPGKLGLATDIIASAGRVLACRPGGSEKPAPDQI